MKNSVIGCSRKQLILRWLISVGFFQFVSLAYASPDTTSKNTTTGPSVQVASDDRKIAEAVAKAKSDQDAKERAAEDAKVKKMLAAQSAESLKAIEIANNVKYSGGLSEALANNKEKGLDWFSNKAFKLDRPSVINICDPGTCYIAGFVGTTPLGVKQINGDFNGRQLQGQIVKIVGVDQYGTIVVARLSDQVKTAKKPNPPIPQKNSLSNPTNSVAQQEPNITLEEVISAIKSNAAMGWARPPSARNGMTVILQVAMTPDGKISTVKIATSSGDTPFDNSAVAAIKNVGGFSEIQDMTPTEFAPYRAFNMAVTTQDLAL
ncbi:energy transducer TonB [Pseudomonas tritici]|uniref:energy transducer TonB family protein n=1 Tax=Pseudomonas tritici TaxID=2745518 RepID=UPI00387B518C